jgi:hypothetical protein
LADVSLGASVGAFLVDASMGGVSVDDAWADETGASFFLKILNMKILPRKKTGKTGERESGRAREPTDAGF